MFGKDSGEGGDDAGAVVDAEAEVPGTLLFADGAGPGGGGFGEAEGGDAAGGARAEVASQAHQIGNDGDAGGIGPGALAVVEGVGAVSATGPDGVVGAANGGEDGVLGNQGGTDGGEEALGGGFSGADEADGAADLGGVAEVDRGNGADAGSGDVSGGQLDAEGEGGEEGEFGAGIEAVDVGGGVGFGVAEALGFGENGVEFAVILLDFAEDVVTGSVENAVEGFEAVGGDTFAKDAMDGNAAADAGFHGEEDALGGGLAPEGDAVEGDEFLVGGDDGFAGGDGGLDDFPGDGGAADQFGDDLDIGVGDDVAPVLGDEGAVKPRGESLRGGRAAADGGDDEAKAELLGDLAGVFGENGKRTGADIAETDDAEMDVTHKRSG